MIFILSDLLHIVGKSGSTMLLQMVLFHSLLWLSDIPLYVCVCVYNIYTYVNIS